MKAVISGGGIAGLSAALALDRAGWSVSVLEKAPGMRAGGYMLDFFGPGVDAAEDLGLLDALRTHARGVRRVDFVNAAGRSGAQMDYRHIRDATGGRLFPILRGDIEQVLHAALSDRVELRHGTSLSQVEETGAGLALTLADGGRLTADLLVGADGIHSNTRRLVFGPEQDFIRPLGFHTAGYFFDSAEVEAALGGDFKMMAIENRMAGLYAVEGSRIMAFFVLRADETGRPDDPRPALRAAFGDLGWIVPEVLAAMPGPEDIYYDVVAQVEMDTWRRGRTILIGDAAYAVSLLAGQGASLAMAGGRALGQVLSGTDEVAAALAHFETQLRPLVLEKQRAGRNMAKWFVPASPAHVLMRDMGVRLMNWPPLSGLIGRFFSVSAKGFSLR
jgi:2-polyprenyl-6-methoxyphenol hydroxylase and related FAD-dependent oxidoreductases